MNRPSPLRLVFLISLPRSGSTLQKILAAHPEVASTGEPWLLLPLAHLDRSEGMEAIYDHGNAARAICEMIARLPNGRATYVSHLRQFCLNIFRDLAGPKPIFLDKDPRYYLILDFLVELFPEAKFIFLFRNPLDVMCSMMNTWLLNRLCLHAYHIDLYEGVRAMSHGWRKYGRQSIGVHYQQFVQDPPQELQRICEFLRIQYCPEMLQTFQSVDFGGSMGDPIGNRKYGKVSTESSCVWPAKLNNRYRIRFARKYISRLGDEILQPWRFSRAQFEDSVGKTRIGWGGCFRDFFFHQVSDVWRLLGGTRLRRMLQHRQHGEVYLLR